MINTGIVGWIDICTYTVPKAAWMAALRTLTATTGLRTRMAFSNGSKYSFS